MCACVCERMHLWQYHVTHSSHVKSSYQRKKKCCESYFATVFISKGNEKHFWQWEISGCFCNFCALCFMFSGLLFFQNTFTIANAGRSKYTTNCTWTLEINALSHEVFKLHSPSYIGTFLQQKQRTFPCSLRHSFQVSVATQFVIEENERDEPQSLIRPVVLFK